MACMLWLHRIRSYYPLEGLGMPVSKGHWAFDGWEPRALTPSDTEWPCTAVGTRHLTLSSDFVKVNSPILSLSFVSNSWEDVNVPECNLPEGLDSSNLKQTLTPPRTQEAEFSTWKMTKDFFSFLSWSNRKLSYSVAVSKYLFIMILK